MTERLRRLVEAGLAFRQAQVAYFRSPTKETSKRALAAVEAFDALVEPELLQVDDAFSLHSAGLHLRRCQRKWKEIRTSESQIAMMTAEYAFDAMLRRLVDAMAEATSPEPMEVSR